MRGIVLTIALLSSATALASRPGPAAPEDIHFGQNFGRAPTHLGPILHTPSAPSVDTLRLHLEAHDVDAALHEADRITQAAANARDRDVAWMVKGMIHRERDEHNLASAMFTKVRAGGGPLTEYGTFYEAEQDLIRGRYWVAARECDRYLKRYSEGRFVDQCGRLKSVAYAKANAWNTARKSAAAYDEEHEDTPLTEQIELTLTLGALSSEPEKMIPRLQDHALSFEAALTGTLAEQELAKLRAAGHADAVVPDDTRSTILRAYSLRYTKQTDRAWELFEKLAVESEDDPGLRAWVEKEAIPFGWRTRNWEFLVEYYTARLEEDDDPDLAWGLYKALTRGGRYAEAIQTAESGLERHAKKKAWRRRHEEIGKSYMLEGDYAGARKHYLKMAERGGWTGLRGTYYAAFSSYMLGDDDDAMTRLTSLVDAGGAYSDASTYWRARLHERNERTAEAAADLATLSHDDRWYGVLARAKLSRGQDALDRRTGLWTGEPTPRPPSFIGTAPSNFHESLPIARPVTTAPRPASTGFASMFWGEVDPTPVSTPKPLLWVDPNLPPNVGVPQSLFNHSASSRTVGTWSHKHRGAFKDLRAAYDMARAGLYDLSGPLFSAVYEEWRDAYKSRNNKDHYAARRMKLQPDEWREVFSFMGDHHHSARFNHTHWRTQETPELQRDARRIGYPLAHARYVWEHSRANDVDPYLILGLMRQESNYNSIARSRVGARGAMQIMPRTGHLLANLKEDRDFTAGSLEDPTFAVGYGIDYLGMLMERFDGVYPLAIASYNGGCFNVSTWVEGTGKGMPMDEIVEHIPYRETRDYVKKVSAGYDTYLSLYAPEGTLLDPHLQVRGDDPTVVDF